MRDHDVGFVAERIGALNETTSATSFRPAISETERARRLKAVNFARGSVRYEGGIQTEEVEIIAARFVAGELTLDEYIGAVKASDTVRLG